MKALNNNSTPNNAKSALGKGLSSLLGGGPIGPGLTANNQDTTSSASMAEYLYVNPNDVSPNPYQPRKEFNISDLEELSNSIKEQGLLQPLVVQKRPQGGYELIAGERRLRACKLAKLEKIPVVVKVATDRGKLLLAIVENVQRSELNIIEEAKAYSQLMDEFQLSQEEVASKVGKSRSSIANVVRLLKLPPVIVAAISDDKISFGHGKILLGIESKSAQLEYFKIVIEKKLSVRELEDLIKKNAKTQEDDNDKDGHKENEKAKERERQKQMKVFKDNLESRTGFHIDLQWNQHGAGKIWLNFQSKDEFRQIYEYLLKSRA